MAFLNFVFKTLLNLVILIFLFFLCLLGLTLWIAPKITPKIIDTWFEGRTGFSTSIQKVNLQFFSPTLNLENITLINPPYYQNKNFMQIKQFLIRADFFTLWRPQIILNELVINIDKLTLVRTAENSINILEFARHFTKHPGSSPELSNQSQTSSLDKPESRYLIKQLTIQLNSISTVGFPHPEDSQNFTFNHTREFTNVTDIQEVINLLTTDIITQSLTMLSQELTPILQNLVTPTTT